MRQGLGLRTSSSTADVGSRNFCTSCHTDGTGRSTVEKLFDDYHWNPTGELRRPVDWGQGSRRRGNYPDTRGGQDSGRKI